MSIAVRFFLARIGLLFRSGCWLALLAMVAVGPGLSPVAAQAGVSLSALRVSLWPEFDQAGVLVILDGELAPDVALPARLSLPIPAAAGQPHAVAYRSADDQLLQASATTQASGDVIMVEFETPTRNFVLEYYDPALTISGASRDYAFDWSSAFAVGNVVLRLQQPAAAEGLTTEPALQPAGVGEFGLDYQEARLGALAAGQTLALRLSYDRSDNRLSADILGLDQAPAPQESAAAASAASSSLPGWAAPLGVAGVLLVALGGAWLWADRRSTRAPRRAGRRPSHRGTRSRAPAAATSRPARPAPVTSPAAAGPAATGAARFCTKCGQALQPGDRFCRACGQQVG